MLDWLLRLFGINPSGDTDEKKKQEDGFAPSVIPSADSSSDAGGACDGGGVG
jgi:hypothetical protein